MSVSGLLALGIAACGQSASGGSGGGSASVGVTKTAVTFGQTVPSSGPAALYGESTAGVRAYFAMVNAQGGVDGRKLKLTALDDQYEPSVAVQQTRKLISSELAEVAVNGSATTKAVLNVLGPQGIPIIGPQTGATYLFQKTPRILFNVWPEYTIEGKLLGSFAQRLGLKKVGVLYQNDDFGQSLYQGVLASGLKPAKVITYDPTQTDFSPQAQQFKSAGVDGVIILAIPKPTIAFLNAMAALNFKPARLMSQVSAIPQSRRAAGVSGKLHRGLHPVTAELEQSAGQPVPAGHAPVPARSIGVDLRRVGVDRGSGGGGRAQAGKGEPDAQQLHKGP